MPRLSVIIPIYNAEDSLSRCIASVLEQTFRDFELILVNDGSTDSSLLICNRYANEDSRIIVIDKRNEGVSAARNAGLEVASGEWVTFIDSDDWIGLRYFAVLSSKPCTDLIVGAIFFTHSQTKGLLSGKDCIIAGEKLCDLIQDHYNHSLFNSPCAKFYRKEIINQNNILFDRNLLFGEDAIFVKTYLLYIRNLQINNSAQYYYDDIGDDIYRKYSSSFYPIYDYYIKMSSLYANIESRYHIEILRHELIGVTFNILVYTICKNALDEWDIVKKYLNNNEVRSTILRRNSLHMKILLYLSTFSRGYLFLSYFKFTEWLKKCC